MFRVSRLFWKLFGAFSLATAASFIIGITYMQLTNPGASLTPPATQNAIRVASAIQHRGVESGVARLEGRSAQPNVAIWSADGTRIAGANDLPDGTLQLAVTAPDGRQYRVRMRPSRAIDPGRVAPIVVGVLVSLFVSAGVAWYLSRPLMHLSRGFSDIARGELSTRLHPLVGRRRDEIADLTREFDRMAVQLQQLLETQARLFHDISHELRSPLARLEVAIGLLRQSPDNLPAMLDRVQREGERLDRLIGELLTLARLKAGDGDLVLARIDLIDLLTAIVDDANFEAAAKHCTVRYEAIDSFVTVAEGETLYRAFENVIRNAVKYAPEGTVIDVATALRRDRLDIVVRDRGAGVPAEMTAAIFEPFNRGDRPTNDDVPGFGLGLAIAKFAIERHGGTIAAHGAPDGTGLQIEISLPRA